MSLPKKLYALSAICTLLFCAENTALLSLEKQSNTSESSTCHKSKRWTFSVLGDTAYNPSTFGELDNLILDTMNQEEAKFVVHLGDYQVPVPLAFNTDAGITIPATTLEEIRIRRDILWQARRPLIYTPGDNDWFDLNTTANGNVPADPLAVLELVRQAFFREGTNVPYPFEVVSQADEDPNPQFQVYIENQRWFVGDIVFVTINTVGSLNNGLSSPVPALAAEAAVRINANNAWLERAFAFALANNAKGMVIITQANPVTTNTRTSLSDWYAGTGPTSGFKPMVDLLNQKSIEFGPDFPIRFIYGDSHTFLLHDPFRDAAPLTQQRKNFIAMQVPGAFTVGRVKCTVDYNQPDLFSLYTSFRNEGPTQAMKCAPHKSCKDQRCRTSGCTIDEAIRLTSTTKLPAKTLVASGTKLPPNASLADDLLVMIQEEPVAIPVSGTTFEGSSKLVVSGTLKAGTVFPIGTILVNASSAAVTIPGVGIINPTSNLTVAAPNTTVSADTVIPGIGIYLQNNTAIFLQAGLNLLKTSMVRTPINLPLSIEAVMLRNSAHVPAGTVLGKGTRFPKGCCPVNHIECLP